MGHPIATVGDGRARETSERLPAPLLLASEDFELYCETAAIAPVDEGLAFAAWLNDVAGDADFDGGSY